MFRKYLNENGITLIETLATLLVLSVISGVVIGVVNSSIKQNNHTKSNINLQQETEIILTELRTLYQSEDEFGLCFQDNMLYKDEAFTKPVTNRDFSFSNVEIDGEPLSDSNCEIISDGSNIMRSEFLIAFTMSDNLDNKFSVSTAMSKLLAFDEVESTTSPGDSGDEPGDGEPGDNPGDDDEYTGPISLKDCLRNNGNKYQTKNDHSGDGSKKVCEQQGTAPLIIDLPLEVTGNRTLQINGAVTFQDSIKLNSHSKLCVRLPIPDNVTISPEPEVKEEDGYICYSNSPKGGG